MMAEKKFAQAESAFSAVLELEPGNTDGRLNRAEAYFQMRDFKKAGPDLEKLLALDSTHVPAYLLRASVNKVRGEFQKQKEDAEFAVRMITQHRRHQQLMAKAQGLVKEANTLFSELSTAEKAIE